MSNFYRRQFDLTGKTAVVTGGAGILGQKFCEGLAEFGASVAILDFDESAARETARLLVEKGHHSCRGYFCDVGSPDSVEQAVAEVCSEFGQVDILHNNAASKSKDLDAFFAKFEDYSLETWREIMSVNIDGMFLVAQEVGAQMLEKKIKGSIIQTASIYGIMAPDQRIYEGSFYLERQISSPAAYSASKASVVGLTKYLASYWGKSGIRVNTLTPGGVESGQNTTFKERYSARVPMGRMARDTEMVGALLFLASDASSYVTGQNIVVDGGLSAW